MDQIMLKGLRLEGRLGITPEERVKPQAIEVDIVLSLDLKPAGATDRLDKTVDYSLVYQEVRSIVEKESFSLLEALAERIAGQVLTLNRVVQVNITVKKLHPPIVGQYDYFAIHLQRERVQHRAYIGLGTNLGNREENLAKARRKLADIPSSSIARFSSVYHTLPWGKTDQPEFLNQVASLDTCLSARELLQELLDIEKNMGRGQTERWGPRIIDLDLLLYGDQQFEEPDLVVPHPWLTKRAFILTPLLEIASELKMPDGRYLREILANLH